MNHIALLSPAKINLTFEILGKLENGYHQIRSIIQPISIFDELKISLTEGTGIELSSKGRNIPENEENLAVKAALLFANESNLNKKISIEINKIIPTGAGLGGGSSNAAATLVGLNRLTNAFDEKYLYELSPKLGADVAVFIRSNSSLVEGIGEKIKTLSSLPLFYYVVLYPKFGVSTEDVYNKWDELNNKQHAAREHLNIDDVIKKFSNSKTKLELYNDLEIPAFELYPELKSIKDLMSSMDAESVLMTGSGSSIFAVFRDGEHSQDFFNYLSTNDKFDCFLAKGISGWHRLAD